MKLGRAPWPVLYIFCEFEIYLLHSFFFQRETFLPPGSMVAPETRKKHGKFTDI